MLWSNLGSPSLHLPASLLLLVFHLHLGSSRIARRRQTAAKPPSLYLHSLPSPTRLPTPIHTTVSAAPPIRSPVWSPLRTRAPVTLQGRRAISLVPNWYADAPHPRQQHQWARRGVPGARGRSSTVRREGSCKPFPPRRCSLAPSPDSRRTSTQAAVHASGALRPLSPAELAKVVFLSRCVSANTGGSSVALGGPTVPHHW